ncbi:MAG: hypothetical protein ABW061_18375 [Polyangiaceae bacterium]
MSSRNLVYAFCLLGALVAAACGTDDDAAPPGSSAGAAGSSGKGNAGSAGKGGGSNGGESNAGGAGKSDGDVAGEGGEGGEPGVIVGGCVPLSTLVHSVIKEDTNDKAAPRPVNDVVFCDDPADSTAYSDLF